MRQWWSTLGVVACVFSLTLPVHADEPAAPEEEHFEIFAPPAPPLVLPSTPSDAVDTAPAPIPARPHTQPAPAPAAARAQTATPSPPAPAAAPVPDAPSSAPLKPKPAPGSAALALVAPSSPAAAQAVPPRTLAEVDARLFVLRQDLKKHRLTGPRALTIGGFVAFPVMLVAGTALRITSSLGDDYHDGPEMGDGTVLLFMSPLALAVGIGGAVWLSRKKRARKPYALEWEALKKRKVELLELSPAAGPTSLGLSLRLAL